MPNSAWGHSGRKVCEHGRLGFIFWDEDWSVWAHSIAQLVQSPIVPSREVRCQVPQVSGIGRDVTAQAAWAE